MTLDVYSGLFEDGLDAVADRLDAARTQIRADSVRTARVVIPITQRETGLRPGLLQWGDWDLNPGPRDYESLALTD